MATKLKQLKLHELSLVDSPANEDARVTVLKNNGDVSYDPSRVLQIHKRQADQIAKGRQRQLSIDARIREVQKRDNCTPLDAIQKLHDEEPELWEDDVEA